MPIGCGGGGGGGGGGGADQSEDKPILDDNSLAFIKPLPEPDDQECERDPDGWVVQWERLREKAEMAQKEKEEQREAAPAEVGEGQPEKKERQREEQCEEGVVREGRGKGRIRLTGQHPLNAEPPVPAMMKAGLITPSSIHFVRNHGPVPRIHWNSHRVVVCGMVGSSLPVLYSHANCHNWAHSLGWPRWSSLSRSAWRSLLLSPRWRFL